MRNAHYMTDKESGGNICWTQMDHGVHGRVCQHMQGLGGGIKGAIGLTASPGGEHQTRRASRNHRNLRDTKHTGRRVSEHRYWTWINPISYIDSVLGD